MALENGIEIPGSFNVRAAKPINVKEAVTDLADIASNERYHGMRVLLRNGAGSHTLWEYRVNGTDGYGGATDFYDVTPILAADLSGTLTLKGSLDPGVDSLPGSPANGDSYLIINNTGNFSGGLSFTAEPGDQIVYSTDAVDWIQIAGAGTSVSGSAPVIVTGNTNDGFVVSFDDSGYAAASHVSDTGNPHSVTKAQVGLSAVQNVNQTNASNLSTGTVNIARLPVGTTSSSVAQGDHTHNNLYYTETETDNLLSNKLDAPVGGDDGQILVYDNVAAGTVWKESAKKHFFHTTTSSELKPGATTWIDAVTLTGGYDGPGDDGFYDVRLLNATAQDNATDFQWKFYDSANYKVSIKANFYLVKASASTDTTLNYLVSNFSLNEGSVFHSPQAVWRQVPDTSPTTFAWASDINDSFIVNITAGDTFEMNLSASYEVAAITDMYLNSLYLEFEKLPNYQVVPVDVFDSTPSISYMDIGADESDYRWLQTYNLPTGSTNAVIAFDDNGSAGSSYNTNIIALTTTGDLDIAAQDVGTLASGTLDDGSPFNIPTGTLEYGTDIGNIVYRFEYEDIYGERYTSASGNNHHNLVFNENDAQGSPLISYLGDKLQMEWTARVDVTYTLEYSTENASPPGDGGFSNVSGHVSVAVSKGNSPTIHTTASHTDGQLHHLRLTVTGTVPGAGSSTTIEYTFTDLATAP